MELLNRQEQATGLRGQTVMHLNDNMNQMRGQSQDKTKLAFKTRLD